MIISEVNSQTKVVDYLNVKCDVCGETYSRTLKGIRGNRKIHNVDVCRKCANIAASKNRPQCQKIFWTDEVKQLHGNKVSNSIKHKEACKNNNLRGEKNGMFGKPHSIEAIQQMIKKRTGKKQSQQTIDKRINTFKLKRIEKLKIHGILNVNREIRYYIHTEIHWYKRIFEKDGWACVKCGSKQQIDAHHKKTLNSLIKEAIKDKHFETNLDKYNFLITCPEILDNNLTNGETLCRKCHRDVHNWGSHNS